MVQALTKGAPPIISKLLLHENVEEVSAVAEWGVAWPSPASRVQHLFILLKEADFKYIRYWPDPGQFLGRCHMLWNVRQELNDYVYYLVIA